MDIKAYFSKKDTFTHIIFLLLLHTTIRVVLERVLLDYPLRMSLYLEITRHYLENIWYFLYLYLLICLFISRVTRTTLYDCANYGIKFYPLVSIAPIIDFFFFDRASGYGYGFSEDFLKNILTLSFGSPYAGYGIPSFILLSLIGIMIFVYKQTKSVFKMVFSWAGSIFLIGILSTPEIFYGYRADFYFMEFLPLHYFIPCIVLICLLYRHYNRQAFNALIKNLRLVRAVMFVLAVVLGSCAASTFAQRWAFWPIFSLCVSVFFAWQYSVVLNDIYDINIDKKLEKNRPLVTQAISLADYKTYSYFVLFCGLSFAANVHGYALCVAAVWFLLGIVYSKPPLRLRNTLLGNVLIGFSLSLSFLTGFIALGEQAYIFTAETLSYTFYLFLMGTMMSMAKDIKDVEGDAQDKVRNLFTIFGFKKAKRIVVALILSMISLPGILSGSLVLAGVFVTLSGITAYFYSRSEEVRVLYLFCAVVVSIVFAFSFL